MKISHRYNINKLGLHIEYKYTKCRSCLSMMEPYVLSKTY